MRSVGLPGKNRGLQVCAHVVEDRLSKSYFLGHASQGSRTWS